MPSSTPRRVVTVDVNYPDYRIEEGILAPLGLQLEHAVTHGDPGRIREAVRWADGVMVREAPLDAGTIAAMERCRVIVRYGVGVDNIDLEAARARRIFVANVPDYGTEEVSDHAVALLMAVSRRITERDRAVREGRWAGATQGKVYRLAGRVLGIVGFGRIGQAFYRKVRGFGFARTLICDPLLDGAAFDRVRQEAGVEPGDLEPADVDQLCREADILSLHAPLTEATRHLINRDRLALMKPTAILVNTSRGGLVDTEALVEALREGRLLGAGLDVLESEPPAPHHPLLSLPNVVLTDHTAWYSEDALAELKTKAAQEVARVLSGERPRCWVNRWE